VWFPTFVVVVVMTDGHEDSLAQLRGGGLSCPVQIRDILLSDKEMWEPSDFTMGGVHKDDLADNLAMWSAIIHEIVEEDETKRLVNPSQLLRFQRWINAAVDKEHDKPPSGLSYQTENLLPYAEGSPRFCMC
jgi:hypothetical protein